MLYVITTAEHADGRYTELKTGEQVLEWYRWYISRSERSLWELRGKDLACWCKEPKPGEPDLCHAAILLELANQ